MESSFYKMINRYPYCIIQISYFEEANSENTEQKFHIVKKMTHLDATRRTLTQKAFQNALENSIEPENIPYLL